MSPPPPASIQTFNPSKATNPSPLQQQIKTVEVPGTSKHPQGTSATYNQQGAKTSNRTAGTGLKAANQQGTCKANGIAAHC
jgi:hypothetical protein